MTDEEHAKWMDSREAALKKEVYKDKSIRSLEAEVAKLREALRRLQYSWIWTGQDSVGIQHGVMRCIACRAEIDCSVRQCVYPKCKPDCWLAALLGSGE